MVWSKRGLWRIHFDFLFDTSLRGMTRLNGVCPQFLADWGKEIEGF